MSETVENAAGARVAYEAIGSGLVVLILHGAYSARDELRIALEPGFVARDDVRRVYVDLPGMGDSPGHESITGTADALDLVDQVLAAEAGDGPFAVIGHSFGGHVARGVAARHADRALGLALICPMLPEAMGPEPHQVVVAEGDPSTLLDPHHVDEYEGYFVVRTPETAQRFNEAVAPVMGRFDGPTVERVMEGWDVPTGPFGGEVLVLVGRHDSAVGFRAQFDLVDQYPRATYVVASGAGHALPHERPELVAAELDEWVRRLR
jgi:pimeloyl-ACP methyl ester carboxylesterase